jgi:hypothetical protein
MPAERQAVYHEYFANKTSMDEEESVRWTRNMKLNDPDVYKAFKPLLNRIVHKLKTESARKFMKFVSFLWSAKTFTSFF